MLNNILTWKFIYGSRCCCWNFQTFPTSVFFFLFFLLKHNTFLMQEEYVLFCFKSELSQRCLNFTLKKSRILFRSRFLAKREAWVFLRGKEETFSPHDFKWLYVYIYIYILPDSLNSIKRMTICVSIHPRKLCKLI